MKGVSDLSILSFFVITQEHWFFFSLMKRW